MLDQAAAKHGSVSLSLAEFVTCLHRQQRLKPLLREALAEKVLLARAGQAGLSVTSEELQRAADAFRRRHGLTSAEKTRDWLEQENLATQDFERALEGRLLLARLKEHVTRDQIAGRFEHHRGRYERVKFRQLMLPRMDLARELLSQIRDEGRDFSDLARTHSQGSPADNGASLRNAMRFQLPESVAETVFGAQPVETVGPIAIAGNFLLFHVEMIEPATLDGPTQALIRQELFTAWVNEQLSSQSITFPLLDLL